MPEPTCKSRLLASVPPLVHHYPEVNQLTDNTNNEHKTFDNQADTPDRLCERECATPTDAASQPQQTPDSKTWVYQRLHGNRTTMTIRVLPEIKQAFTRRTRELGLSTCHVAEGLFNGWLMGIGEQIELVHQSPTINQVLVRDVERPRRYAHSHTQSLPKEVEGSEFLTSETVGNVCVVCGKPGRVRTLEKNGARLLCMAHFEVMKTKHRADLIGWKVLAIGV